VIETNICAAEVLKRQLPEAQGAIYCGVSAKLIPTGKAPPCWGFPSAFDARRSALKLGELEARAIWRAPIATDPPRRPTASLRSRNPPSDMTRVDVKRT
jgi:hypothetical protein